MKHRRRDVLKVICITQDLNTSLHHEISIGIYLLQTEPIAFDIK